MVLSEQSSTEIRISSKLDLRSVSVFLVLMHTRHQKFTRDPDESAETRFRLLQLRGRNFDSPWKEKDIHRFKV